MALIQCNECGSSISNHALSCPQCGAPRADVTPKGDPLGVLLGLGRFLWASFVILATIGIYYGTASSIPVGASAMQISQLYDMAKAALLALIAATVGFWFMVRDR